MIAAIYARKSTDDKRAKDDPTKSVARQIENARIFAAKNGWTVHDSFVFVDDGISGAEFEKRPGLMRMMNLLEPKPPFEVVVVSEQKSIGREAYGTGAFIKKLAQAGVEIFEYMHGRCLSPKNALEKFVGSAQGFADEAHREATSERVHEAHEKLHKLGRVVGGRVFGYRNVHIYNGTDQDGNPRKSHTEREVNPVEAAVVQRIFELYAGGDGLKRITKLLNAAQAPKPKPFVFKDGRIAPDAWSPSTVRAILSRGIYHGDVIWNKSRKRDDYGQIFKNKKKQKRDKSEWMHVAAPEHLRIIDEDLWNRVASRRADVEGRALRFESGRLSGKPPRHTTINLLAGLATCGLCGGGLVVETSPRKRGRIPEYICARHRNTSSCTNTLHIAKSVMEEAVLQAIEEHVLTPEAIEQVITLSERDENAERAVVLEQERRSVEKRIDRLTEIIAASSGDYASLLGKLRELEAKKTELVDMTGSLQPVPRLAANIIEDRLAEWRRLLRQSTTQARAVIQRVIVGRITFTPHGGGYEFSAQTRFSKLFSGVAAPRPVWVLEGDVRGTEHLTPEDTFEADYGRLLERAAKRAEGMASYAGQFPNTPPVDDQSDSGLVLALPKLRELAGILDSRRSAAFA